jgi:hypothetical protein
MKLDLRLTHRFLDQLWCQAVVVFLFEDSSLQKEYLSKINKTLASSLTPLIDTRFITGKRDELILIAPQERIKAEKLLFVGLGPVSGFSGRILPAVTRRLSSSLDKLNVNEFCIMVPRFDGGKMDYEKFVRSTIRGITNHYAKRKKDAVDFILKVLVSVEEDMFSSMQSLQQSLRRYLDPHMEYTIVIDDSRGLRSEKV